MNKITVKNLKAYLRTLPNNATISLSVKDYFSVQGQIAQFMDFDMTSTLGNHIYNESANHLTLKCDLEPGFRFDESYPETQPKIIYRKIK